MLNHEIPEWGCGFESEAESKLSFLTTIECFDVKFPKLR